jgi:hypothetical protein
MAIDFFDREVTRLQDMFNEAFGNCPTTNINAQNAAIFAVAGIGVLAKKINKARDKKAVRPEIQKFMRTRGVTMAFLEKAINDRLELLRRNHGTAGKRGNAQRRTAV